jgi:hypothetical protein
MATSESAWYWRTFNSDVAQKNITFLLKAMGDFFVIVVGVSPKDHRLTCCNGDLKGRVQDIHLKSNDAELTTAIVQECDASRIKIPEMGHDGRRGVRERWARPAVGTRPNVLWLNRWRARSRHPQTTVRTRARHQRV